MKYLRQNIGVSDRFEIPPCRKLYFKGPDGFPRYYWVQFVVKGDGWPTPVQYRHFWQEIQGTHPLPTTIPPIPAPHLPPLPLLAPHRPPLPPLPHPAPIPLPPSIPPFGVSLPPPPTMPHVNTDSSLKVADSNRFAPLSSLPDSESNPSKQVLDHDP